MVLHCKYEKRKKRMGMLIAKLSSKRGRATINFTFYSIKRDILKAKGVRLKYKCSGKDKLGEKKYLFPE